MLRLLSVVLLLLPAVSSAQERIDGSFPFQTDPAKKYSLYVPSNYEEGVPHRLMVGFHPFNTSRWDAASWCDTLIVFAETNGLLMACPDGGVDGRVDDPIDLDFTTALLDSMAAWYDVDEAKVYAMGFSWGGRATYRYGLANTDVFGGYIPIGAAINGTNEVNDVIENATDEPFYIVHGANDAPNTRYFPILNALIANDAIVESILMGGVGHTIDFPNRNEILGTAFQWVDSVNCALDPASLDLSDELTAELLSAEPIGVEPHPASPGQSVQLRFGSPFDAGRRVELFDSTGRRVGNWLTRQATFDFPAPATRGAYLIRVESSDELRQGKLVVR